MEYARFIFASGQVCHFVFNSRYMILKRQDILNETPRILDISCFYIHILSIPFSVGSCFYINFDTCYVIYSAQALDVSEFLEDFEEFIQRVL